MKWYGAEYVSLPIRLEQISVQRHKILHVLQKKNIVLGVWKFSFSPNISRRVGENEIHCLWEVFSNSQLMSVLQVAKINNMNVANRFYREDENIHCPLCLLAQVVISRSLQGHNFIFLFCFRLFCRVHQQSWPFVWAHDCYRAWQSRKGLGNVHTAAALPPKR